MNKLIRDNLQGLNALQEVKVERLKELKGRELEQAKDLVIEQYREIMNALVDKE